MNKRKRHPQQQQQQQKPKDDVIEVELDYDLFGQSNETAPQQVPLRVYDVRFLRTLQSAVRAAYNMFDKRYNELSQLEQGHKKAFHAMFSESRRIVCRAALQPRHEEQIEQYLQCRDQSNPLDLYSNGVPWRIEVVSLTPAQRASIARQTRTTMPFTAPVAPRLQDLAMLYNNDRFWAWIEKTDGQRMVWGWVRRGKTPISFCMNLKGDTWLLPVTKSDPTTPMDLFEGSLWDMELVPLHDTSSKYANRAFMVFDCLMSTGRSCGEYPARDRVQIVQNALTQWGHNVPLCPRMLYSAEHCVSSALTVRCKQPYGTDDIPYLTQLFDRSKGLLDHDIDGLIGYGAAEDPVVQGRCSALFKIKLPRDQTLDFILRRVTSPSSSSDSSNHTHNKDQKENNTSGVVTTANNNNNIKKPLLARAALSMVHSEKGNTMANIRLLDG